MLLVLLYFYEAQKWEKNCVFNIAVSFSLSLMLGTIKIDGFQNIPHSLRYSLVVLMALCLLPKKFQLFSEALKLECPHLKSHISTFVCKKGLRDSRVICEEGI